MPKTDLHRRLEALARAWEVSLGRTIADRLLAFFELLILWNQRINLTGARTVEDLIGEHLPDSFALSRLVPSGARVVDVGTGGGLPAIPLALLRPDLSLTLVEPRAKRAAFLRTAARELSVSGTEIETKRAEQLPPAAWGLACSRATFSPGEWLPLGARLVQARGLVAVFAAAPLPPAEVPQTLALHSQSSYETAAGHSRWIGAFARDA